MSPRAFCPGGDHRPPATGGTCACGMVTRVPSRTAPVRPGPLVRPEVRDAIARCLYDGPGDPLAPDATDHRPDDLRISGLLRLRADRMLAALAAAGLVVTVDGELRQAARGPADGAGSVPSGVVGRCGGSQSLTRPVQPRLAELRQLLAALPEGE